MATTLKVKEGTFTATWSSSPGVTANCGMNQIWSYRILVKALGNAGEFPRNLPNEKAREVYFENEEAIARDFAFQCGGRLAVLSDVMVISEELRSDCCPDISTADMIRSLIKYQLGSVTLSPLVSNFTYDEGYHEIQAALWIPPNGVCGMLTQEGYTLPVPVSNIRSEPQIVNRYEQWMFGGAA